MRVIYLTPVFWTLFFLILAETVLEFRASSRGYSTALFGTQGGGNSIDRKSNSESIEHHYSFGPSSSFPFRSRIINSEKQPHVTRIWIASASHAEDSYVSANLIFPSVLESTLNQNGTPSEIINASRAGLTIESNRAEMEAKSHVWQPDIALLYQMSTDLNQLSKKVKLGRHNAILKGDQNSTLNWSSKIIEQTTLYELVKTNLTTRISENRFLLKSLPLEIEVEFERLVLEFVQSARSRNIVPIVCTFAVNAKNSDDFHEDDWYGILKSAPYISRDGWLTMINRFNSIIIDLGKRYDFQTLDLAREFTGKKQFFRDFVHFSVEGHHSVGTYLAEVLKDRPRRSSK